MESNISFSQCSFGRPFLLVSRAITFKIRSKELSLVGFTMFPPPCQTIREQVLSILYYCCGHIREISKKYTNFICFHRRDKYQNMQDYLFGMITFFKYRSKSAVNVSIDKNHIHFINQLNETRGSDAKISYPSKNCHPVCKC